MSKIILAPDSYKDSLEAIEVAKAMERGIQRFDSLIETVKLPMSDGGEGLIDSLIYATEGNIYNCNVIGPLGEEVNARWGVMGDGKTAVIEMAEASGLQLVSKAYRDPKKTTTYGTGELIKEALEAGIKQIIIGIGGSATNDAGMGMVRALGGEFYDSHNNPIGTGGKELINLNCIDLSNIDSRISKISIKVACDVNNPLIGPRGASYIFAPQKGASSEDVELLEKALKQFDYVVDYQLGKQISEIPGAGAAGGLGAGLMAFLGAKLMSGINLVMEAIEFERQVKSSQLVITGEGSFDSQTLYGKVPFGVAQKAQSMGIPTVVVAGNIKEDLEKYHGQGINAYFSVVPGPMDERTAFEQAPQLIENTTHQIIRLFKTSS